MCSLGPVLDLSSGGMRVLSTRPYQGHLRVTVWGMDVELNLHAKTVWARRLGFRRHELGLVFVDVDEDVAKILTRIAGDHRQEREIA